MTLQRLAMSKSIDNEYSDSPLKGITIFKKKKVVVPLTHEQILSKYWNGVKKDCKLLRYVPQKFQTFEMREYCIEQDPSTLSFCVEQEQKLVDKAVGIDPLILEFVREEFQNEEMCKSCVEQNWKTIEFCKIQTQEIADIAFSQNWEAVYSIKNKFRTEEMIEKMNSKHWGKIMESWTHLKNVPHEEQTPQMRKHCVEQNWYALSFCTEQNEELAQIAFAQDPQAVQFINGEFETPEMIKATIKKCPRNVYCITNRSDKVKKIIRQILPFRDYPHWIS